jgi:hypothetical protein
MQVTSFQILTEQGHRGGLVTEGHEQHRPADQEFCISIFCLLNCTQAYTKAHHLFHVVETLIDRTNFYIIQITAKSEKQLYLYTKYR